jgi:hypothetical protein
MRYKRIGMKSNTLAVIALALVLSACATTRQTAEVPTVEGPTAQHVSNAQGLANQEKAEPAKQTASQTWEETKEALRRNRAATTPGGILLNILTGLAGAAAVR